MRLTNAASGSTMTCLRSISRILSAELIIVFAGNALCQGTHAITELDPAIAVAIEVNSKMRVDLYAGREKSEEIKTGKEKVGAGISFRFKPVFKRFLDALDTDKQHLLVLGTIYEYSKASEPSATSIEHKVMIDGTLRYMLPCDLQLSNRNRLEIRWVNGNYHYRYRNRPMLEKPVKIAKRDVTPYLAAKVFWDQR